MFGNTTAKPGGLFGTSTFGAANNTGTSMFGNNNANTSLLGGNNQQPVLGEKGVAQYKAFYFASAISC